MDQKHPIYEATAVGILVLFFFLLTLFPFEPELAKKILFWFSGALTAGANASETISRLVALGVALNFIGGFTRMISTIRYQHDHWTDEGREILKQKVVDWVDQKAVLPEELKSAIREAPADALFAWIHYSDPRQALINWGRTRSHYRYLAENWVTAIILGVSIGFLTLVLVWLTNAFGLVIARILALIAIPVVIWFFRNKLLDLNKFHKESENAMVAAYVASRIDPELSRQWLPPIIREERENLT
jgi:hypothetical protein